MSTKPGSYARKQDVEDEEAEATEGEDGGEGHRASESDAREYI